MSNRRYDDEDLEIPQIDGMENKKNLEETDLAGIPLFLKGEDSANKKPVKKEIEEIEELPDFLTGGGNADMETKVAPTVLSEIDEEPQPLPSYEPEEKKSSMAGTIILSILIFIVLTAVLMFVGIKVVDHFAPKPSIAPLEPVVTETPETSPAATAVTEGEGA